MTSGSESEELEELVATYAKRIERLEACIREKDDDVAVPLGLVVRNLPLPSAGVSETQQIRSIFREINATNIDVEKDVVCAVRKGQTAENLGSVMVEMSSCEARANIMKNKKSLANHHNHQIKKLVIKNMKSWAEIKMVNDISRRLPGLENCFISSNGKILDKSRSTHPW